MMAMWRKDMNYGGTMRPGFSTPPGRWNHLIRPVTPPMLPRSERKPNQFDKPFHVMHKIPALDSPYARAKHVQLVVKDPHKAIAMFWAALNAGDRVDSALKDMALTMKQVNRSDEAIEAIKSFRHLCSLESQDSLDNILLELYKRSGRMEEHIEVLQKKIKHIEDGLLDGRRVLKPGRSHGRKCLITVEHEYSRLLGNLAWVYLQQNKYSLAEELYRKALSFEQDKNRQCNLAICLMYMNRMTEAKILLECVRSSENGLVEETYAKSFERASKILVELESHSCEKTSKPFSSFMRRDTEEYVNEDHNSSFVVSRKLADSNNQETSEMDEPKRVLCTSNDSIISSSHIEGSISASLGPGIGLQSSPNTSFAGELNREGYYIENYNKRTCVNREMVPGGGIGSISALLGPGIGLQSSPNTSFAGELNREGSYVENYNKRTGDNREMVPGGGIGYDGYIIGHVYPNPVGGSPTVPFVHTRKGPSYSFDNVAGKCNRKLSFAGFGEQGANPGLGQAFGVEECANERKINQEPQSQSMPMEVSKHFSLDSSNKSWASMRAEDDAQLPKKNYFDENTNDNIFFGSLAAPLNQTENLSQKMESLALEDGYNSQAGNADTSTNQEVQRSVQETERSGQVWQLPWMFEKLK